MNLLRESSSLPFYLFSSTWLINSIKHEHLCKILYSLQNLQEEMWGELVEVVSCDMREWKAPEKADILVSELLGSFGDNELSPECLDGAQRFLNGMPFIFISTLFICI